MMIGGKIKFAYGFEADKKFLRGVYGCLLSEVNDVSEGKDYIYEWIWYLEIFLFCLSTMKSVMNTFVSALASYKFKINLSVNNVVLILNGRCLQHFLNLISRIPL